MSSSARSLFFLAVLAVGGGCSKEAKVERALGRADKNLAAGHYDLAQSEYEAVLRLVPRQPKAVGRLGVMYFRQGRYIPSFLLLDGALKSDPDNIELQLVFGQLSHAVAKSIDARAAAKKVLERQPTNEEALLLLAETCISTRDQAESRRMIEELRQRHAAVAGFHVALGALGVAQGDHAAAETELKKALELNPKSSAAFVLLGRLHSARKDIAKAGEAYKTAAELSPLRSLPRLEYVEHLISSGDTGLARQELASLTKQAPDFILALTAEMNLAYRDGRYADAGAVAEKILGRDHINHDAMSLRAAVRIAQGDVDGGIGALKIMEGVYTKSALVKYRLAHAYLRKGDQASAEESLTKAIQIAPTYDEAIVLLAELNLQKGNAAATVAALTQLLNRQPRIARAYVVLAQAYQSLNRLEDSLKILRAYAERAPKSPEGPYFMAIVLKQLGRKAEARQSLEQALKVADNYWPAAEMMINDDLLAGRTVTAREQAQRGVEKFSDQAIAWLLRAKVRFQENDLTGTEADAAKAIELAPTEPHAYILRARVLLAAQQPQQALDTLAALAAKSNQAGAYLQLGVLNETTGNRDAARLAYEKALALDAKLVLALNNLAMLLSADPGQRDQAFRLASQARELAPTDPHVLDTLGWIAYLKGRYAEALPLFKASAERMPGEPAIQLHLGVTLYRLGQEEAARQALERVVSDSSDVALNTEAKERLALLNLDPAKVGPDQRGDLEARLRREPDDPVVRLRLAALAERAGAHEEAAQHYEEVQKINPKSIRVLMPLIRLYAGPLPKPGRVRELSEAAHAVAPYDGEMAWELGRIAWVAGDFAWAAVVLQAASRVLPDQPELLFELARAMYGVGRVADAERSMRQALAMPTLTRNREAAQRYVTLIAATRSPAQVQAVLPEARRILTTEPQHPAALMIAALAQELANDPAGAVQSYDALLARYPQFVPAMRQQAILLAEHLGDDKRAEEQAQKARKAFPEDPGLAYVLGTVAFRRGEYGEAVRLLNQAARARDQHAATYFYLGMSQFQLKNSSESRAHLQRALELNLPPQEASEARRILDQLRRSEISR